MNLTRGGLVPAKLINLSTQEEVKFMFNPFEYTLSKQNSWEKKEVIGQNIPAVTFSQGGSVSLSLKLHFDSLPTASDVRSYTNPLWKMMLIDSSTVNQASGKGTPPAVAFSWGRMYFKAIITSMTQKFTLFKEDGTPLRCVVDISLEQLLDEADIAAQIPGATSSGETAQASTQATQGTRLDHVAGSNGSGGSTAENTRKIAEKNNMDDPLKVKNGQNIKS
jgi:hypothetical protein